MTIGLGMFTACSDDDDSTLSSDFNYQLHNGQTVPSAAYVGTHPSDFEADMTVDELDNGNALITVTLKNSINGAMYAIHAHDKADPSTTPNMTPYNETPNADVFAQQLEGNGGTVSVSQEATMSYDDIINSYEGFFVVHDPLQPINTADITTYLVVGDFAREQPNNSYQSTTFSYDFNTGQIAPEFAYSGSHPTDLSATIRVDELEGDQSRVTVTIFNSVDGETYPTHSHDKADPSTTPNNTPYLEAPNADVYVQMIQGTGDDARMTQIASMSYEDLTTNYEGFFVIHDPLQPVNTADPTTYVVLGNFAR